MQNDTCDMPRSERPGSDYTKEELEVLAKVRRDSGRTCPRCAWYRQSGGHRGCFPEGKYRKWLSEKEYAAGCHLFSAADRS